MVNLNSMVYTYKFFYLKLYVDSKGIDVRLFQCALCAIDQAIKNMDIHRNKPIYLLVSRNKTWCFGTLTMTSITDDRHYQPVGEMCINTEVIVIVFFIFFLNFFIWFFS
jgi:hypothetical protein